MDRVQFTVGELNDYVNNVLSGDPILKHVRVKGEISNYILHASGHRYFALKDKDGLVSCTMFRSSGANLSFEPKNGDKVVISGHVGVYKPQGKYQVYVTSITQEGVGNLYEKFEQLKAKLKEAGYFNDEHKKPIPTLPKKIGIVTSHQGAAVQDMINIITRRYDNSYIVIYPAKVQGENAHLSIMSGIAYFNNDPDIDVIIIGRGGGSLEDLWCFNEEELAKAVFNSKKPIISAVGHETDFSITDFVADLRAPTPSAAAELCVPVKAELKQGIVLKRDNLFRAASNYVARCRGSVITKKLGLERFSPVGRIEQQRQRIDTLLVQMESAVRKLPKDLGNEKDFLVERLKTAVMLKFEQSKSKSAGLFEKLDALNPTAVLKRGYAIVEDKDSKAVDSAKKLTKNDKITLVFHDGTKAARVE